MTSSTLETSVRDLIAAADRSFAQGDSETALAYLREAQVKEPENAELVLAIGHLKLGRGDLAGALEDYTQAARFAPNLPMALSSRALVLQLLGRSPEAEPCAFQALQLRPDDAVALKVLARIGLDRGELEAAEKICHRLLLLSPGDSDAKTMMNQVRARQPKPAPVRQAARETAPTTSAPNLFGDYTTRVRAWEALGPEHQLHQLTVGDYSKPVEVLSVPAAGSKGADGFPLPPVSLTMGYGAGDLGVYMRCGADSYRVLTGLLRDHDISLEPGDAMLDWGCAAGRAVRFFRQEAAAGCEVWGGDVHAPSIQWAQQHLSPPFQFFNCSSLPNLPFKDGKFKFIYGLSVMTHLINMRDLWLLELSRVLSRDGCIILTVHNEDTWAWFKQRQMQPWVPESLRNEPVLPGECVEIRGSRWDQCYTFFTNAYLRKVWGQFFQVAEIRPCADCYQSAVILRQR